METELVRATWGLVVATALLVIAAIVPLIRDAADRREQKQRISSQLIPDMNILRSRLEGADGRLANSRSLTDAAIGRLMEFVELELGMIGRIIGEGERPSLLFANEVYIVRHLLTQASNELKRAQRLADKTDPDDVRARDDALLRVRRLYKAALMSLDAAEQQLPSNIRTINGESFWDRFYRVSREREAEAERSFVVTKNSKT
jgi:hypothetical protein